MIASPSKNTHFSPYKILGKKRSVVQEPGMIDNIYKIMDIIKIKYIIFEIFKVLNLYF